MTKEKILVIAPRFLGDSILSVPFFRNLRIHYPDAQIEVIAHGVAKQILSYVPYVDNVYDLAGLGILGKMKFVRDGKYAKAYLLKRSLSAGLLMFNSGIKNVIGFNTQGRRLFLTKPVKYQQNTKHEAEYFLDLLRADNIKVVDTKQEYFIDSDAVEQVKSIINDDLDKKALIVAASTYVFKNWQSKKFAEVIEFLVNNGYSIYFTGLSSEKVIYDGIMSLLSDKTKIKCHNMCKDFDLKQSIALVSLMDITIGIDTGFCHLSSALGIKTLAMYGLTPLKQWKLLGDNSISYSLNLECSPCKKPRKNCRHNFRCMTDITPDMVIDRIKNII